MPHTIAVIGAGELGATLARRLAAGASSRRVLLLDADEGRAKGKALDILQSGPVEGFDTRVEGGPVEALEEVELAVMADPAALDAGRLPSEAATLIDRMRLYVDGRLVARAVAWGSDPGFADIRSMRLGTYQERNGAYRGMIDEVKLYARALSDEEIAASAARGS